MPSSSAATIASPIANHYIGRRGRLMRPAAAPWAATQPLQRVKPGVQGGERPACPMGADATSAVEIDSIGPAPSERPSATAPADKARRRGTTRRRQLGSRSYELHSTQDGILGGGPVVTWERPPPLAVGRAGARPNFFGVWCAGCDPNNYEVTCRRGRSAGRSASASPRRSLARSRRPRPGLCGCAAGGRASSCRLVSPRAAPSIAARL
jgi:hypothetical protein